MNDYGEAREVTLPEVVQRQRYVPEDLDALLSVFDWDTEDYAVQARRTGIARLMRGGAKKGEIAEKVNAKQPKGEELALMTIEEDIVAVRACWRAYFQANVEDAMGELHAHLWAAVHNMATIIETDLDPKNRIGATRELNALCSTIARLLGFPTHSVIVNSRGERPTVRVVAQLPRSVSGAEVIGVEVN